MSRYKISVWISASLLTTLLAAIHAPGQISVDSGIALYEGVVGRAVGWGPTFMAAVLAWLGGGVLGASLFVAFNCIAIYGVFAVLLTDRVTPARIGALRAGGAALLALNPLFMFYAGIVWKDVMLASAASVALAAILACSHERRWPRWPLLAVCAGATLAVAMLALLRQQGALLAIPLALALAWVLARRCGGSRRLRAIIVAASLSLTVLTTLLLSHLAALRVAQLPSSPVSVGLLTVRAYDIIGMVANSAADAPHDWSRASDEVVARMRAGYSHERIDTIWHDPVVRGYINALSEEQSKRIWLDGVKRAPGAYLRHRARAFEALLGMGPISGCVPAYWGVAALPEHLEALSLAEEMDPRDRLLGRAVQKLEVSMVFRHWWYVLLLAVASVLLVRRPGTPAVWVVRCAVVGGWGYLASFMPATIACDFRYLYPVAAIATIACMFVLLHPSRPRPGSE